MKFASSHWQNFEKSTNGILQKILPYLRTSARMTHFFKSFFFRLWKIQSTLCSTIFAKTLTTIIFKISGMKGISNFPQMRKNTLKMCRTGRPYSVSAVCQYVVCLGRSLTGLVCHIINFHKVRVVLTPCQNAQMCTGLYHIPNTLLYEFQPLIRFGW